MMVMTMKMYHQFTLIENLHVPDMMLNTFQIFFSLIWLNNSTRQVPLFFLFTDEETKAQRGRATYHIASEPQSQDCNSSTTLGLMLHEGEHKQVQPFGA